MGSLRRGILRIPSGARWTGAKKQAAEELLECAQSLMPELAALDRSARRFHKFLSREVSAAEIAVLATPAADLLGSLEILYNSEIKPIVNRLGEVEVFLTPRPSRAAVKPRRKQKASPGRKAGQRR